MGQVSRTDSEMTLRSLLRLRRSVKHLAGCEQQLTRIADCLEMLLAEQGIHMRKGEVAGKFDAVVSYSDEEQEAFEEFKKQFLVEKFGHESLIPKEED